MASMNELFQPVIQSGLVTPQAVRGCTDAEIEELMRAQGVTTLPGSYREFLTYGGKDPYWLSRNGEWDFNWLLEAKETAREIVVEDYEGTFEQFSDSFVFQTHQGYIFQYFAAEDLEADDPNFWIYEGDKPPQRSKVTFTGWLNELVEFLPRVVELRRDLGFS
ncbi:SMI1/KNR4 family protein [Nocardia sp. NPDC020380]|uniref:SMI1/KNR4 family protein n=1 Tax=Nocardia sp. NPDC020380 TaxID=3364309 RepID=UPI00379AC0E7